jgi:hypothetical protein
MPVKKIAKKAAVKKARFKKSKYYVFNLKLLSNQRKGDQAYEDIISYLYQKKIIQDIQSDKQMLLRTQFSAKDGDKKYLYGKIAKFTKLDGKDWINLENFQIENVEIPKNRFPNLKETDYIFIPSAHRFAVLKSSEVGLASVNAFLNGALKAATNNNEQYDVWLEQSRDVFEEILDAVAIEKLEITVTYTNDDIVEGAEEFMDQLLKEAGVATLYIEASAGPDNKISVENQVFGGALALAKSNGKVTARIVNNEDKKVTLKTEEHPQEFTVEYEEHQEKTKAIAHQVIKEFRDGEENG